MAIAFARCEYKGRSSGGNAVRSSAYNERDAKTDEQTGKQFDFRDRAKPGDIHLGVFLPEQGDQKLGKAEALWNAAEVAERRKDSQVAKEVVIALPKELGPEDWKELVLRVVADQVTGKGLGCQADIHMPDEENANPHCHILITTRRVSEHGLDKAKARDTDPTVSVAKGRHGAFKRVDAAEAPWHAYWRHVQDEYFKEQGLSLRVDPLHHQSEQHLGPKRFRGEGDTAPKQRAAATKAANDGAWRSPRAILDIMTKHQPSFRLKELDTQLRAHIPDKNERATVRAAILADPRCIPLYDRLTGQETGRYTSATIFEAEQHARSSAASIAARGGYGAGAAAVGAVLATRQTMRAEQRAAFLRATGAEGLVLIQGRAGTGKSYTVEGIAETYTRAGRQVVGLGPTNVVAKDMEKCGQFRRAATVHSECYSIEKGKVNWNKSTVVIVDEAGMLDTKQLGRVLTHARDAGAKVILVGDDRQLQSVEAGGLFRELVAEYGAEELNEVVRQEVDWQRQASEDFGAGRVRDALQALDQNGAISWAATKDEARDRLVEQWARNTAERPSARRFVLAYTNQDVHDLNSRLREIRAERGEIGSDRMLKSEGVTRAFATGDRIQMIKTDKSSELFNGEVGTIQEIDKRGVITAKLDSGRKVRIDPEKFDGYRHGYAGTVYKSQGKTLDETLVLHSKHFRAESIYVALSRQTKTCTLHVGRDVAADREDLVRQCARSDDRRAATSYCQKEEAEAIRAAREAAGERGADPADRRIEARFSADMVAEYIRARTAAGELWAQCGAGGQPETSPDFDLFQRAQERRHVAVRIVVTDRQALSALKSSGAVRLDDLAVDHLMATGTKTRREAEQAAWKHELRLGLRDETPLERLPGLVEDYRQAKAHNSAERYDLYRDLTATLAHVDPVELKQASQQVQGLVQQLRAAQAAERAQEQSHCMSH